MTDSAKNHFDCICKLYSEYQELLDKENVEIQRQTLKEKIIIQVCQIFYLDEQCNSILDEDEGHNVKKENKKYSDEIFLVTLECFKNFEKQFHCDRALGNHTSKTGKDFARYVLSSVKRKLNYLKAHEGINEANQMKIPREKLDLVRKIKKEDEHLSSLIKNKERRAEQIKKLLTLDDSEFELLYNCAMNKTQSLDSCYSEESDEISLMDFVKDESLDIEGAIVEGIEARKTLTSILSQMQQHWEKKRDKALSDILTVHILQTMFDKTPSTVASTSKNSIAYANIDILQKFSFLNREMVNSFFNDTTYSLPNQVEIGAMHGGLTKSAISKKLSRFLESLQAVYGDTKGGNI